MSFFKNLIMDLKILKDKYNVPYLRAILANRGFHSLFFYRISHLLWKNRVPFIPLVLTRLIQIIYGIDIDYRAQIEGGVIIIHGIGTVIGSGAKVDKGTVIYHQVTIGIKGSGKFDGFPKVGRNCILGAGVKLLGKIAIGENSVIGA